MAARKSCKIPERGSESKEVNAKEGDFLVKVHSMSVQDVVFIKYEPDGSVHMYFKGSFRLTTGQDSAELALAT